MESISQFYWQRVLFDWNDQMTNFIFSVVWLVFCISLLSFLTQYKSDFILIIFIAFLGRWIGGKNLSIPLRVLQTDFHL